MIFLLTFFLGILPSFVYAQDFLEDVKSINESLSFQVIEEHVVAKDSREVPGTFFEALVPRKELDPTNTCEVKEESDETLYEVVVVGKLNSQTPRVEILPSQDLNLETSELKKIFQEVQAGDNSLTLNEESLLLFGRKAWDSHLPVTPPHEFDPKSSLGRELFVESMVMAAGKSSLGEKELVEKLASIAGKVYQGEEERFNFLTALSSRLYRNYNTSRNPGHNNSFTNPNGLEIPDGDMTVNELLLGASRFSSFDGGVCNDISEAVAMVGEHLFPEKDVLTVNSGTHFGVVIADGKTNRIIDGKKQYDLENTLFLDPRLSSSNLRISKVQNGALKEIAVVDTEMGQFTEEAFQTGKNLLKTSPDISSVVTHFKKKDVTIGGGYAQLPDSRAFIVVAKYQRKGQKWSGYVGGGVSGQEYLSGQKDKYQVHVRTGFERNILDYVSDKARVHYDAGMRVAGMYSLTEMESVNNNVPIIDMSGSMDVVNKVSADYGEEDKIRVRSVLEVEHTLGSENWGETTGSISYVDPKGVLKSLRSMSFYLNQVNADITLETNIKENIEAFTNLHYQGSAIGQRISVLAGLSINAPDGAELLVFMGHHDSSLKGFKTKHSLLATSDGAEIGGRYRTKNGVEVGGSLKENAGDPSVEIQVKLPLGKKKK